VPRIFGSSGMAVTCWLMRAMGFLPRPILIG
jgi:hypothetical protein